MKVKSLELRNYRNYENLTIDLGEGKNILYGDNAQGKTNVLEALYLSATTKSHRGSRDREIIRFDQDEAHIRTIVCKREQDYQIDMHLRSSKTKGVAVNKVPIHKASELFGILNIVFFSPEDLNIIKNGPAERRKFMDMELCQLDKVYLSDLTRYHKTLQQRNHLLKDIHYRPDLQDTLAVWDSQLIHYGRGIIRKRNEFVGHLNMIIGEIHEKITGGKEKIVISYEPDTEEEAFEQKLENAREKDLKLIQTTVGPHRDDIIFHVNGMDIRKYGSQGQQRTSALSLKLSEIRLVEQIIHDKPVLLLDDVLSELDGSRQNYLLNSIVDIQTLITCTGLDEFVKNRLEEDRIFEVCEGRIYRKN